jgi:hypothetical protein
VCRERGVIYQVRGSKITYFKLLALRIGVVFEEQLFQNI